MRWLQPFHTRRFDDVKRETGTIFCSEIRVVTKDGRMNDSKVSADENAEKTVDERIASLVEKMRKEAVPERLLELARELQKALDERKR